MLQLWDLFPAVYSEVNDFLVPTLLSAAASSRGDLSSLKSLPPCKRQGVLDALKEGEEGIITDDERLRIPRLAMLDEDGGNEFNSGIRREIKASCLVRGDHRVSLHGRF